MVPLVAQLAAVKWEKFMASFMVTSVLVTMMVEIVVADQDGQQGPIENRGGKQWQQTIWEESLSMD